MPGPMAGAALAEAVGAFAVGEGGKGVEGSGDVGVGVEAESALGVRIELNR